MLAKIETIEQLQSAIGLMNAGSMGLYLGMATTIALFFLAALGIYKHDERMIHAARRGQYALLIITGACAALAYVGIFGGYYFVSYIRHVTENNETLPFKISGLWAGQQGSLLFWCLILNISGAAYAFTQRHNRTDRRLPFALMALAAVQFFFYFIMCNPENFERSNPFALEYTWMLDPKWATFTAGPIAQGLMDGSQSLSNADLRDLIVTLADHGHGGMTFQQLYHALTTNAASLPAPVQQWFIDNVSDGKGMNPALHNYWVAIHPPVLYLGYVGFTIPFIYACGALMSGDVGEGWLRPIRAWAMTAWGFLTIGIAMGGLWAYEILGWGGYWAWDPVENASFIPWLTGTAFIHSVIVTERRGMLKVWTFALVIVTYCMTVIGTFLVRSGIIESVHAFGDTGVKTPFFFFMGVVFLGSMLMLVWRSPLLKAERKLESIVSREGAFLFNNLALVGIALSTLAITFWPVITTGLYGEKGKQSFGIDAFNMINIPLFLLLLVLTGVGPVIGYRRNSIKELVRNFAPGVALAVLVCAGNTAWLAAHGYIKPPEGGEAITVLAGWVKVATQVTLLPIVVFVFLTVVQEFYSGATARRRSTGEGLMKALGAVVLGNRRRYGGYIVHIGILMVASGIYFSSYFEVEGSVVCKPGGYAVLDDRYLVYYDTQTRSSAWDVTQDIWNRDPEQLGVYKNMLRTVRKNPGKSASEIIDKIKADAAAMGGGQLPPMFEKGLPRMTAAISWGVDVRDKPRVYESFETGIRIFDYQRPREIDAKGFADAHDDLLSMWLQMDVDTPSDDFQKQLDETTVQALALGAELPDVLDKLRSELATLPDDSFRKIFGLRSTPTEALSQARLELNKQVQAFHDALIDGVTLKRSELAQQQALKLPDAKAKAALEQMRPLSLNGLRAAAFVAPADVKPHIEAEINAIIGGVAHVHPTMRIFYDKREGTPRMNEPVKDPAIWRKPTGDLYFVLQNTQADGKAYFRYFIKPQMMLGLAGLFVIALGTIYALLPSFTRRRPEIS
ncbi:MAG: heme lyase CcmF/NrfE family subunit [Planctomycetes bacterium]|nr:heme lyase CcmF/NrfE family subunit [Planctomycetota bacterium]